MDHVEPQDPTWNGDVLRLTLARSPYNVGPAELEGVLVRGDGGGFDAVGLRSALALVAPVRVAVAQGGEGSDATPLPTRSGWPSSWPWPEVLLLNLMPCVSPVLSLKIMGFVRHAAGDPTQTASTGSPSRRAWSSRSWPWPACSWPFAGPAPVGWGFQLQSPPIVAALCILMFVIGLVLVGVVEPGLALTRLGAVGADDVRYRGSFLTGVLAAVVATPCTAPFMGAAIGVALVRPAVEGLAVFATLGVGMATPYVVLSSWPAALARMPRPGPWMETLKQALAFPMFAVSVWLVWVFGLQTGVGGAAALLASLTLVGFGTWILGHWPISTTRGRTRAVTRAVAATAFLTAGWAAFQGTRGEPPTSLRARLDLGGVRGRIHRARPPEGRPPRIRGLHGCLVHLVPGERACGAVGAGRHGRLPIARRRAGEGGLDTPEPGHHPGPGVLRAKRRAPLRAVPTGSRGRARAAPCGSHPRHRVGGSGAGPSAPCRKSNLPAEAGGG